MAERTWISLGVGALVLLVPAAAQAAAAHVRALNAVASGTVTIQVDAKPAAVKLGPGSESPRFSVAAGTHTFTAVRGTRTVARRRIPLTSGERVTVVYASDDGHAALRLIREPSPTAGTTVLRVANYSEDAGLVDVGVGGLVVARGLDYNRSTLGLRIGAAVSPTGLVRVTARPPAGPLLTAARPLVLATRSVGIFVIVPRGSGSRLLRLAYDTAPPTPTRQPAVTGTRRFGNAVRCEDDTWTPSKVRTARRWTLDGTDAGTASTFALTSAASAGHVIGCTVTATANGMTTRARTSFQLPPVPVSTFLPFIEVPAGLTTGDFVECNTGAWSGSPTAFDIRWIRVADGFSFGTGPQFKIGLGQNGTENSMACEVVASNDGGRSDARRSSNTVALGIAPTVSITGQPADPTVSTDAFFQWSIGGGGADTVECSRDGAPLTACIGTVAQTYHNLSTSVLGQFHTFSVTATNPVDTATASYTWTVLPPPPHVAIATPDPAPDTSASFVWSSSGGPANVACDIDGSPILPCSSPTDLSGLAPATQHTFTVTATNANPTTPVATDSVTWTAGP